MTPERQRHVLVGLVLAFAAVVGWQVLGPGAGSEETAPIDRSGPVANSDAMEEAVEVLRLSDLDLEPAEFRVGRDPFRFVVAPPPPPAPKPERSNRTNSAPRPAQQAKTPASATPQPPPVDVVYLGRFGPSARPIAVFTDGTDIYNVLEGEVIKGDFIVDKIGYESADLKFVGFPDAPSKRLAVGG